jgi:hypothetical protein
LQYIYQHFISKIPNLQDFDYEKLGFLTLKHRRIIELYSESQKLQFLSLKYYNIISNNTEEVKPDRLKIVRNASAYMNLETTVNGWMPILNELIKENNLVREDFRLQSIPVVESTFRKASFWKIPILWFFRWFK